MHVLSAWNEYQLETLARDPETDSVTRSNSEAPCDRIHLVDSQRCLAFAEPPESARDRAVIRVSWALHQKAHTVQIRNATASSVTKAAMMMGARPSVRTPLE